LKVFGIVGWSGSGKTKLLTAMIPVLRQRGISVSTIKHAHHDVGLDVPGKDSWRHREAGASEVILAAPQGFALFGESAGLEALLARLAPVDLVLVEGFRGEKIPKIEVFRPALGKPPLWPEMEVMAVASDAKLPDCRLPVLDLNAPAMVADFVLAALRLKQ
jgi:molybdopterin-guanine dinucleotide biosynthesis protein B